mgnify:CR=1 FL=1
MSAQHTPWRAVGTSVYFANLAGGFRLSDSPNAEEHARLCAAAPELLAALNDCRRVLEIANFTQELASATAAIAKATGSAA